VTTPEQPRDVLEHYELPESPIYIVGTFDKGITILSQQVRALNLAWALIESGDVLLDRASGTDPESKDPSRKRIAVVGAGFTGLTVAAGLLKKRVNADITVFERRDTFLPLQHGSDSRWLHPHIYDWPGRGSEAYSAALPVLNWTASRASDVVVQILKEWADVVGQNLKEWADFDGTAEEARPVETRSKPPKIQVFCNTRHMQISKNGNPSTVTVEWIGEPRNPANPAVPADKLPSPVGDSDPFHIVVLAVGFGLESGTRTSYWRNETLAQPHLGQARSTYIVSGAGDGAMIDLCRLRISHFRQDRILAELFSDDPDLLRRLRDLPRSDRTGYDELDSVWEDTSLVEPTPGVLDQLRKRLRQDTTVLLRVLNPNFSKLFVDKRVSFQNRLLAYLLFRCGAFTLVTAADDAALERVAKEHGVTPDRIIIRHGTDKKAVLTEALADCLHGQVKYCFENQDHHLQTDVPHWMGGYFDMPGIRQYPQGAPYQARDDMKRYWRKEYLPSPTEAIATAFCSAVAGFVANTTQPGSRLRVTLHRRLVSSDENVLQQCCAYQGQNHKGGQAGRTFPRGNGTVGAAFLLGEIIHSKPDATPEELKHDMKEMNLSEAAQSMSEQVASVAAIPLIADAANPSAQDPRVVAVLYLDIHDQNAFAEEKMMPQLVCMCQKFLDSLPTVTKTTGGRIANTEFWQRDTPPADNPPADITESWQALRQSNIPAPRTHGLRHLNFDFSDFIPVDQT
jgi:FAD dependent oxidoreductase